ncbi:MAG: nondiscriminating glutamyl-tRNA synthetase [Parcubacteria group bacterium Licking1014_1]|nr:MAG: nondiscriminating glutamyl-tRNA synthetase [Parcubacteria group bacterium Licking1014_1]
MAKKAEIKKIRVRFAPSPTGPLHIGGARTALFNYLFAKKNKGKFILRIEDTDQERSELKWVQEIIDELKWLGIEWDEGPDIDGQFGPYKQSQRSAIYRKYLKKLLDENKAYYCFCSEEELEAKRQEQMARGAAPIYDGQCAKLSQEEVQKKIVEAAPSVIRFRIKDTKIKFEDLIRNEVEFDAKLLGDIIIAKSLDAPLFHFTVVVDDFEMNISHVIRGEEHLSNTPKQILIQESLGFERPAYAHLPLMLNPDRSKLSKRHGDVALKDYHLQGYLAEAIINFMVFLGWNPGTEKEIFSLPQLAKEFSVEKVQKAGAVFNIQKLDFFNGLYIREKTIEKLTELCLPFLIDTKLIEKKNGEYIISKTGEGISIKTLREIIQAYRSRLKKLSEIVELTDFFFEGKLNYNKDLLKWDNMEDKDVKEALLLCDKVLSEINDWNIKKIEEVLLNGAGEFNKEKGYPEKNRGFLLWPLRVALSGKQASAGPFEIAEILGKEKTLQRIEEAKKLLD